MAVNKTKYPYKLARLVHHNYDLDKRWHILFYAWNIQTERLTRKRFFDPLNRLPTVRQRLDYAENFIRRINADLRAGKVLGKDDDAEVSTLDGIIPIKSMTVIQAITHVRDEKDRSHRETYKKSFNNLRHNWDAYLEHTKKKDFKFARITRTDVFGFHTFLVQERKLSNKTHNNLKGTFATVANFLMKREPGLFKTNPFNFIDKLPVVSRKHAAFSPSQTRAFIATCEQLELEQLKLFVQFEYYTLARPAELIRIQIRHLDPEQDRVFIPGNISKGRTDEWVGMSRRFKQIIEDSGILKYPPDFYVFSRNGAPGQQRYSTINPFYNKNVIVLETSGLHAANPNHSLYSFKHTGAIDLYRATKDIKLVQQQLRHKVISQTETYLRDLGVLHGFEGIKDFDGNI